MKFDELNGITIGESKTLITKDCKGNPISIEITKYHNSLLLISCQSNKAASHNMAKYIIKDNCLKFVMPSKRDYDDLELARKW